jgi:hypothetical protein
MCPLRAVDFYIQVKIICTIHQMAKMKLKLPMQSSPIATKVVSSNPVHVRCNRYNIML